MTNARMGRGALALALLLATATWSEQGSSKQPKGEHQQGYTASPAIKPASATPEREAAAQSCPGSYQPHVSCAAISADADVDQARNAENQTWWLRWEVLLTFSTLVTAFWAMVFAKRAAAANRDTVEAFIEVERADLFITLANIRERPEGPYDPATGTINVQRTWLDFDVVANNLGRSSALIMGVYSAWYDSPELKEPGIVVGGMKKYIAKAGQETKLELSGIKDAGTLPKERFLFVNVAYRSPLRKGRRLIKARFEVFGIRSNVPYREHAHEDCDIEELQRNAAPIR